MPNRIIKESICTSEEIDQLDAMCETFFYRLMVSVDDFGLLDARPAIVKSKCYPLKSIEINSIQSMLGVLSDAGLISLYQVEGKPYLQITSWAKHQQIRAQRAKFPTPDMGSAITCNQLIANVPVIQSNPIQSESNPNPITPEKSEQKTSGQKSTNPEKPVFDIPEWINPDDWNLWIKTRKGKKMLPEQMQAQVSKLAGWREAGMDYGKALKDAAAAGWQGLFEPRPVLQSAPGRTPTPDNFAAKDYGSGVNPL